MTKINFTELFVSSNSEKAVDTAKPSLFNDENPNGYFSREELANHLLSLKRDRKKQWQIHHLDLLFKFFKSKGTLTRFPQHTIEDGEDVTWISIRIGKVVKPVKIIHFSGMKQLIDDYASGVIKINQTLEELCDEANS
ncbi:hypothetical protein [Pedobacter puniceum]|uniref:Uncharacterized protein n=1 Tax=Pedobacter puniceum TaxID=2666136 RepID=A0A7K0FL43_9SPHI|nr:hypothetical protein [Pedobacter puniceum]MRX46633.1 hypothetical protein [Pedobacter puniceum]